MVKLIKIHMLSYRNRCKSYSTLEVEMDKTFQKTVGPFFRILVISC